MTLDFEKGKRSTDTQIISEPGTAEHTFVTWRQEGRAFEVVLGHRRPPLKKQTNHQATKQDPK